MEINNISGASGIPDTVTKDVDIKVKKSISKPEAVEKNSFVRTDRSSAQGDMEQKEPVFEKKDPTANSIESAFSSANSKLSKTRCEYSYDEDTRRVSIKVYDKDSDELIREVPPEESLEMLQRIWELAGIMVDEKR
ncbi:MAG: flagellar protein FlaG [Lachnospiraceae bacterium]|nr:flagellar protein FlaG [Lachnospiraceae bacterium]